MKTSFVFATLAVVGAGAVSAGAVNFFTKPFQGSDTLYDITNLAIQNSGLGTKGDYIGGGSGAGENNMTASPIGSVKQLTAPMSKMMTTQTCTAPAGVAGDGGAAGFTHASGIVIGLDGLNVYAGTAAGAGVQGGAAGACNSETPGVNGSGQPLTGLKGGISGAGNWSDNLALLYGGMNKPANTGFCNDTGHIACTPFPTSGGTGCASGKACLPVTDCNSAARQALVTSWSNFFATACTNQTSACSTAKYNTVATGSGGFFNTDGTISVKGQLWHAFRRDDNSGTADVFATLIGLGTLQPPGTGTSGAYAGTYITKSLGVSSSANAAFGATPYCNALNWDSVTNTAANQCADATGNILNGQQYVGPGGIPQGICTVNGAAPPAGTQYKTFPSALCSNIGGTCNGTGTCVWDGAHMRPPTGTWGDAPEGNELALGTNVGADVLPTSYQDNDPIRRPCIGQNFAGNNAYNVIGADPTEEVCNLNSTLGLVLPVPAMDFIPSQNAGLTGFPVAQCNAFTGGQAMSVQYCGPANLTNSVCPDGAKTFAGGCQVPGTALLSKGGTSQCEIQDPSQWPIKDGTAHDARIFNLTVFNGASQVQFSVPTPAFGNLSIPFSGGFSRIHQSYPIWDSAGNSVAAPNVPCQSADASDAIGCLVQADPCSLGFAGDGAKAWATVAHAPFIAPAGGPGMDALQLAGVYPTTTTVQNSTYPGWRKLYFNSAYGFDSISSAVQYKTNGSAVANDNGEAELALGQYESNTTSMTSLLSTFGFFSLGPSAGQLGVAHTGGSTNTPFCEDFNELMVCSGNATPPTANVNACRSNLNALTVAANGAVVNAGASANIPSDPSYDPTATTTSTVCGNGTKEAFEDCDWVSGSTTCTKTCRFVLP